ncbi:MAG: signal peptidase I [Lachnospiraceae bacterium]
MRRRSHDYRGGSLSFRQKEKKLNQNVIYEILTWVFGVAAAVFLAIVLVYSVGIRTSVVGASMEPSLHNGQEVLINRVIYQFSSPKRGDVIVFRPNGNQNSHFYVKRVIGLPGETVQIVQGQVYLDGELYRDDITDDTKEAGIAETEIELGAEEYFVLGDNRDNSEDSRSANIGNVSRSMIEGKAWFHLGSGAEQMGKVE